MTRAHEAARLVDQLVATALLLALRDGDDRPDAATVLAHMAEEHPASVDLALGRIVRREEGRPSDVTDRAVSALRLARTLVGGPLDS